MNTLVKQVTQRKIFSPQIIANQLHSNAEIIANCKNLQNRNPRNLELLRIARKPTGWHLDKAGREFWHKLIVRTTARHVIVELVHFENKIVVSASTEEWAIRKHLYRLKDGTAYLNLGRIMAKRCLESGITHVYCEKDTENCEKLKLLHNQMEEGGISLEEPSRYVKPNPWDKYRPQKPWEVED